MGEGAVGVKKLISIRSREIVKRRTDLKHVVDENLQILTNIIFLMFLSCMSMRQI